MIEETEQNLKEKDLAEVPKPESVELAEGELDSVAGGWTWTDGGKTTN
jgi:hypothetical protein